MGWIRRWKKRIRTLVSKDAVERELDEELAFHLEMETEKNLRAGMNPEEARRQAAIKFGGVDRYKEKVREARVLGWVPGISLDFQLGFRMLVKYPGLTVVAGLAMAFAIWVGATSFEFLQQVVRPRLPLDDGDRVVAIVVRDAASNQIEPRLTNDFFIWRQGLRSVEDLGAFRSVERNLIVEETLGYPLETAEISPSAFRLTRVAPLHGRFLVESDGLVGAPPVLLLGFETWRTRFGGDAAVVGQTVRLGTQETTIVGVMPEGFTFPFNHEAWTPLRLDPLAQARLGGPAIQVFGRLAPEATLEGATAEVSTLVRRAVAGRPGTHEHLRAKVLPYGKAFFDIGEFGGMGLLVFNSVPLMLLVLISATVALLLFARAATRESELAVRSALGAPRGRIVTQLFIEALVLGGVAAALGVAATNLGLQWVIRVVEAEMLNGGVPFWISDRVSPTTIFYTAGLTVLAALVSGLAPAFTITRRLDLRLKQRTAGGGGMRFGWVLTGILVVQVAATVAFPSVALAVVRDGLGKRNYEVGFTVEEFLAVRVLYDRQTSITDPGDTTLVSFLTDYRHAFGELEQRLLEDPSVLGLTYSGRLPRTYHGWNQVEVDAGAVPIEDPRGHRVGRAAVDVDYFDVLGAPVVSGRSFAPSDVESGANVVIVDQPFVDRVLGGANPLGRHVRYIASDRAPEPTWEGPWFEIVGVAPDLGVRSGWGYGGVYHPTRPGGGYPLQLVLHLRGDPLAFTPRVRAAATLVDPRLRIADPVPLDDSTRYSEDAVYGFWGSLLILVSGIALFLSLATIYSVMAFTVARRTREIGVRVALGASALRVVGAILKRPLAQVAMGITLGLLLTAVLMGLADGASARAVAAMVAYGLVMTCVCAASCIVPTRRALAVEPTEALRVDQ